MSANAGSKQAPLWKAEVNGVQCYVRAWSRAEARNRIKERLAMKTLPRTAKLKKVDDEANLTLD